MTTVGIIFYGKMTKIKRSSQDFCNYAWGYFEVHAGQRLTTFRFYLIVATLLTTGLFATLQKDFKFPTVSLVLGALLIFFSFVFRKLDARNKQLVENGQNALRLIDDHSIPQRKDEPPHQLKLFARDDFETKPLREKVSFWNESNSYSYSSCFALVFFAFTLVGFAGLFLGVGFLFFVR